MDKNNTYICFSQELFSAVSARIDEEKGLVKWAKSLELI